MLKRTFFAAIGFFMLLAVACVEEPVETEPDVIKEPDPIPVTGISVTPTSLTLIEGESSDLTASITPKDADNQTVTWSSSDSGVASVDNGRVTAVKAGSASITAKSQDGRYTASCSVTVEKKHVPVERIELNLTDLTLAEGKSETLVVTVFPADATPRESVSWTSSDTQVASVDNGKVTALKVGSAKITASVDGISAECKVDVYQEYGAITVTDIKPVDILPVIGQVVVGDKEIYSHIEHLRLAEATKIRDMMWEYGAGKHTKEEYQQLMMRLNAGMMEEYPIGYDNFEVIGEGKYGGTGDGHSHGEWSILTSLINHANMKVVYTSGKEYQEKLKNFIDKTPDAIVIMGCSAYGVTTQRERFLRWAENEPVRELCKSGHLIIFKSGGNVDVENGVLINKSYHRDVEGDGYGLFSLQANANGINDPKADIALFATVGTNDKGDSDQTGVTFSSSCFPVGFHDKALFAGRVFPFHHYPTEEVWAEKESVHSYQTSFANYLNTAMMSICFQMYAEAKDVFELLDMVRSTCLTDYIRLDGQTQPLQLINPAGLYKKYLTPQSLPGSISFDETLALDKGYYKGVLFSIPGAEVKVNGEWVAFDNKHKDVILSQNPMNLEWRLSGELLRKYGYTSGQTVEGQIVTVDDTWGGLRLEIPMTVQVK